MKEWSGGGAVQQFQAAPEGEICLEEEVLDDLCNGMADELFVSQGTAAATSVSDHESLKPFAAFGSYRQRHGSAAIPMCSEAPAKLGSAANKVSSAVPLNIPRSDKQGMRRKVLRSRNRSSELEREEAWERKRDQHVLEELKEMEENRRAKAVGRSLSDCGQRPISRLQGDGGSSMGHSMPRTRSLTDEDLDELRGSIDLGFGFKNQADPKLWNTLPAVELCYAINQQYQSRMASPASTFEDDGTASEGATSPMSSPSWNISSPGDHPQQVKTRLRHWAQAVACTVRQNVRQEFC